MRTRRDSAGHVAEPSKLSIVQCNIDTVRHRVAATSKNRSKLHVPNTPDRKNRNDHEAG